MKASASSPRFEECEMAEILSKRKLQDIERRPSTSANSRLNDMILRTYKWLRTSMGEYDMRVKTFSRVSEALLRKLRLLGIQASTILYGSLATGLYLPESDIDIYLEAANCGPLDPHLIADILKTSNGQYGHVFVSGKDERSCVKVVDKESSIRIDITFSAVNASAAVDRVWEARVHYPLLEPMVLVLKYLLSVKKLDRTTSPKGGLSSYGLVLMVINFLKGHRPPDSAIPEHQQFRSQTGHDYEGEDLSQISLVDLFSEFFDLYGTKLDLSKVALSAEEGFVWKKSLEESMGLSPASSIFTIQDPVKPDNDVGYNVYMIGQVVREFASLYESIQKVDGADEVTQDGLFYQDLSLMLTRKNFVQRESEDEDSSSDDSSGDDGVHVIEVPVPARFYLYDDLTPAFVSTYGLRIQTYRKSIYLDRYPIHFHSCIFYYPTKGVCFYPLDPWHNNLIGSGVPNQAPADFRDISSSR
ncbi:hypothetical protein L596_007274 [Steinernema carpocapsae]|uniref:PAP-associated domain-containing protein n=1 Tax=Steinernema carpocapsae TaxID=34508 RepID=A0A4U5P9T1_STECR|nr:hypothetical protein L596_007274 [Steinernema carpocapsae]